MEAFPSKKGFLVKPMEWLNGPPISGNLHLQTWMVDTALEFQSIGILKSRVHAEMFKDGYWDVKVVDNTNGGAIYVMDGGYHNSHRGVSVRNLHAKSGWTGYGYGKPRVSAPLPF